MLCYYSLWGDTAMPGGLYSELCHAVLVITKLHDLMKKLQLLTVWCVSTALSKCVVHMLHGCVTTLLHHSMRRVRLEHYSLPREHHSVALTSTLLTSKHSLEFCDLNRLHFYVIVFRKCLFTTCQHYIFAKIAADRPRLSL